MNPLQRALVAAALGLAAAAQAEPDPVALVKNVTASVGIVRDGVRLDARAGTPLFVSDRLVSAPFASAGIVFHDGTRLTLGPSSELLVRDYVFDPAASRYAFSVYLAKGAAVYASGRIGKLAPEAVKVDSPLATVGVRGSPVETRAL